MRLIALLALFFLLFLFVQPSYAWWNSSWTYRTSITINGSYDNLTDYQAKINVINTSLLYEQGKIQQYCNDTRFTWYNSSSLSEVEIPYWIESCNTTDGANSTFWIKVPSIAANSTETVYMYYGNPSTISESNGTATFEFFDDFNGDLSKWTTYGTPTISAGIVTIDETGSVSGGGYYSERLTSTSTFTQPSIVRFRANYDETGIDAFTHMGFTAPDWSTYALLTSDHTTFSIGTNTYDGANPAQYQIDGDQRNTWNVYELRWSSGLVESYINDILLHQNTNSIPSSSQLVRFEISNPWNPGNADSTINVDWILVRKYASPEPTATLGAEEIVNMEPQWSSNATKLSSPQVYDTGKTYGFQINWTDPDGNFANATFQLGRPDGTLTNYTIATTPAVQNISDTWYINFTQAQLGTAGTYNYTWYGIDLDGSENRTDAWEYVIRNILLSCDAGGPYVENSTIIITGNISDGASALTNQPVTIQIKNSTTVFNSTTVASDLSGNYFAKLFVSNLNANTVLVNSTYLGVSKNCTYNLSINSATTTTITCSRNSTACSFRNYSVSGWAFDSESGATINSGTVKLTVVETGDTYESSFTNGYFSIEPQFCLTPGKIYNFVLLIEGGNKQSFVAFRRPGKP